MPSDSQPPVWEQQIVDFLKEPVPERIMERGVLVTADVLAAGVAGASIEDIQQVSANAEFPSGSASVLGVDRTLDPSHALSGPAEACNERLVKEFSRDCSVCCN